MRALSCILATLLFLAPAAHAGPITYTLDSPRDGSPIGTITTDGNLGAFTWWDIVSWQYTVNGQTVTGPTPAIPTPSPGQPYSGQWSQTYGTVLATPEAITLGQDGGLSLWVWSFSGTGYDSPNMSLSLLYRDPGQVVATNNQFVALRSSASANPEPSAIVLLVLGVAPLLWRKMRCSL